MRYSTSHPHMRNQPHTQMLQELTNFVNQGKVGSMYIYEEIKIE